MFKKKPKGQPPGSPAWMTTYSDLVTQLLCFFVMLFAFSSLSESKYQQIAASLRAALSGSPSVLSGGLSPVGEPLPFEIFPQVSAEFQEVYEEIEAMLAEEGVGAAVEIYSEERGMVISFKEKIFFNIGSSELLPEARNLLLRVGKILAVDEHDIRVEGHTCDLPIQTASFPSNWELSTSRATNVTRFLIEEAGIAAERLGATGYAEFRPIAPNNSEENRVRNRRVDILLLSRNTF
ncbi:MAG TPA: flagellar motor protein MotB [Firmicutes bacterium]|jgi:chemotaxis protein MotB|nr:flagellar motor protein MotB [Bacillota bacterium]